MARVALEGVTKVFAAGTVAVDGLSLEVRDGELLVVVGPSGCGKSTMLRLLAGLEQPTHGNIYIGDRAVDQLPPHERRVGMVFQSPTLYPHLSVFDNLTLAITDREPVRKSWWRVFSRVGKSQADAKSRVAAVARQLEIESLLERWPWQLSGGEHQRVTFAKLMLKACDVWLLDEPLTALDRMSRSEMRRELRRFQRETKTTAIYVTHDATEALSLGDRVAVLNAGRLQQVGTPQELYDSPANRFVACSIGTQAINLIAGSVMADGETIHFRSISGTAGGLVLAGRVVSEKVIADREVDLAVRPENVELVSLGSAALVRDSMLGVVVELEFAEEATLVHVDLDGQRPVDLSTGSSIRVVAKAGRGTNLKPGDRVGVTVKAGRFHLFDRQTGKNLQLVEKA